MHHRLLVSLHDIKEFLVSNRRGLKKTALAIGMICALIMAAVFCVLEKIFAHPFEETPLAPGAFEAWCVAQAFGAVADFFKGEAEENITLIRALI